MSVATAIPAGFPEGCAIRMSEPPIIDAATLSNLRSLETLAPDSATAGGGPVADARH